jgi:hypothetical protein
LFALKRGVLNNQFMSSNPDEKAPKKIQENEPDDYKNPHDLTPRREGGGDALAEIMPNDSRADEKVIANNPQEKS